MRELIHKFLLWLPLAIFGGVVGVAQAFPATQDWFGTQWKVMVSNLQYPGTQVLLGAILVAYITAVVWTSKDRRKNGYTLGASSLERLQGMRPPAENDASAKGIEARSTPHSDSKHSEPQRPPLPPQPIDRVFLGSDVSAADLMNKCEGATALQARSITGVYLGKWIRVTGAVAHIGEIGTSTFAAIVVPQQVGSRVRDATIYLDFPADRERLEIVRPEETLDAVGKIRKITSLQMELENCEIIKPDQVEG